MNPIPWLISAIQPLLQRVEDFLCGYQLAKGQDREAAEVMMAKAVKAEAKAAADAPKTRNELVGALLDPNREI